jgi:DNA-binding NtrC family response regulator
MNDVTMLVPPGTTVAPRKSGRTTITRSTRLLVADDDHALRASLADELASDGFEVVQVRNGEELLALLGSAVIGEVEPIDMLVTDNCMPGFTGLQVLGGIREAGWQLPVILMSAFCNPELRSEAARLDAVAVLEKPFDADDLRLQVMRLLPPYLAVKPEIDVAKVQQVLRGAR